MRPSALGDVCRTVPVLVSLRRAWPDARIDWVVRDSLVSAVAAHPDLTEIVPFPRSRFAGAWRRPAVAGEMLGWARALRRRRYDLVIDCQGLGRSGLITRLTGAPCRVGFRDARELASLAYTRRVAHDPAAHTVDAMLALVAAVGVEPVKDLRLHVSDDDRRWWADRRAEHGPARYAVLAPTARWPSKRWPTDRWRDLAAAMVGGGHERLVIVGGPGEEPQAAGIAPDAMDLVGSITIGRTMAVIAAADVVVAHDSAPLHMAVGFDRPCVGLFGPTDPDIVGPYERPEAVVRPASTASARSYRHRHVDDELMKRITVDDVLARVDAVGADAAPLVREAAS
ncbi:MAG: glycosyltransferase family 9 protein [Planctomycetes bacterium]|nr:glycosyltransferase family 9 protein [Planctomycetota bacterium]